MQTGKQFRIRKGLNLPVAGAPRQEIEPAPAVRSVAVLGLDYVGLKPRLKVEVGARVALGQTLFIDKRDPDVQYVAPGSGTVSAIERGARRVLQSIVIELDDPADRAGAPDFGAHDSHAIASLTADQVRDTLLRSGLWTALRTRPFGRVARSDDSPDALFVTAVDTRPLAPDPAVVIAAAGNAFHDGLRVLRRLVDVPLYLCRATGTGIDAPNDIDVRVAEFAGPHPAGLVGTHIHLLHPVGPGRGVWHLGYQDVIAIGRLFTSGRLDVERVVSLAGPKVREPRLLRTRLGTATDDLVRGELLPGPARVVSGSLLNGRHAAGWARFLGRYHLGIAVLAEPEEREFLGWFLPGLRKFSANRIFASHLLPGQRFALNTSRQGSRRAIVPVGHFEKVMPLDILPTPLLKALVVRDIDTAQALGCLELDEEDLALCSLVDCSKVDYGAALRASLDLIERES